MMRKTEQMSSAAPALDDSLIDTIPQLVWAIRPDGWHEYVNQRWRDYIGLPVEQVQTDQWSPRQFIHQNLSRVEKPVGQLDRLIRELLDVSKIQAGQLEFRQETINLDTLLHEVRETIEQTNGTHTIVMRDTPSLSLVGDKDRLEQVFTNLLSNAIKYAPDAPLPRQ